MYRGQDLMSAEEFSIRACSSPRMLQFLGYLVSSGASRLEPFLSETQPIVVVYLAIYPAYLLELQTPSPYNDAWRLAVELNTTAPFILTHLSTISRLIPVLSSYPINSNFA